MCCPFKIGVLFNLLNVLILFQLHMDISASCEPTLFHIFCCCCCWVLFCLFLFCVFVFTTKLVQCFVCCAVTTKLVQCSQQVLRLTALSLRNWSSVLSCLSLCDKHPVRMAKFVHFSYLRQLKPWWMNLLLSVRTGPQRVLL